MEFLKKLCQTQASPYPLALFRIAYSAVLLFEVFQLIYFQRLVFDPVPFLIRGEFSSGVLLTLWAVVICGLGFGYRTRLFALLNTIFGILALGSLHEFEYHLDYAILSTNFILNFLPISEVWSVDAKNGESGKRPVTEAHRLAVPFLALGLVYFDSIFHKLGSPSNWLTGLGYWWPASVPFATWMDLTPFLNQEWLMKGLGYGAFLFEAAFLFLLIIPRVWPWLVGVGLLLHVGILVAFPIPWFALGAMCFYLPLLSDRLFPAWKIIKLTKLDSSFIVTKRIVLSALVLQGICILFHTKVSWMGASVLGLERFWANGREWTTPVIQGSRMLFGIVPHTVFMDFHFQGYDRQFAMEYIPEKGPPVHLPLSDALGQPSWYSSGRIWVYWTFRVNGPVYDEAALARGCRKIALFWAIKNRLDLSKTKFKVLVRPLEVPTGWKKNFLSEQLSKPWSPYAEVSWNGREMEFRR